MNLEDNKNSYNHSIKQNSLMNKQEGTFKSPPVTVYRISINGVEDNYVTLSDHYRILAEKDAEIARLKKELSERNNYMWTKDEIQGLIEQLISQKTSLNEPTEDANSRSNYHNVHFDNNIDVSVLTQKLIELSGQKKGINKGEWVIKSLKSWGIVYKILKDKYIFIGNNTDFCKFLLEDVFPNVNDDKRKIELLKLKPSNMTHLSAEIKDKKIFEWRQEYKNNPKKKIYEECNLIYNIIEKIFPKIKKNK